MPNKHMVTVTVKAEFTYRVEVEGYEYENKAIDAALLLWREKMPEDFQVSRGYITEWETDATQTAFTCEECGKDIKEGDAGFEEYACPTCQQKWIAEQEERQKKLHVPPMDAFDAMIKAVTA